MKLSVLTIAAASAAAIPAQLLVILAGAIAGLVLLVLAGIALPAVWSARPARRQAAAAVLRLILDIRCAQATVNAAKAIS